VVEVRDGELAGQRRTWNGSVLLAEHPSALDYRGKFYAVSYAVPAGRSQLNGARRTPPSSAQETTLDLLWIRDGMACFAGGRTGAPLYRAVIVLEGPAQTPRALASADPGALAGYRAVVDGLEHALHVVVRAAPFDAAAYAARFESRSAALPAPLAALAEEHARWARRELEGRRLLSRRAYVVVPAERATARKPLPALPRGVRKWLRRRPEVDQEVDAVEAAQVLDERCARLTGALGAAGVGTRRLDDLELARLYRACWGAQRQRSDRDLLIAFGRGG
jgi:hypothetical protein